MSNETDSKLGGKGYPTFFRQKALADARHALGHTKNSKFALAAAKHDISVRSMYRWQRLARLKGVPRREPAGGGRRAVLNEALKVLLLLYVGMLVLFVFVRFLNAFLMFVVFCAVCYPKSYNYELAAVLERASQSPVTANIVQAFLQEHRIKKKAVAKISPKYDPVRCVYVWLLFSVWLLCSRSFCVSFCDAQRAFVVPYASSRRHQWRARRQSDRRGRGLSVSQPRRSSESPRVFRTSRTRF